MALYDRTYVFSVLCSIFHYVIKQWLHALQLSGSRCGSREHKVIMVDYEYTYHDHEYIIRTMNTKYERCFHAPSCTQDFTRLS